MVVNQRADGPAFRVMHESHAFSSILARQVFMQDVQF